MTKKAKIIAGVVGGVLVLGGIGSLAQHNNNNDDTDNYVSNYPSDYQYTVDEFCARAKAEHNFGYDYEDQIFTVYGDIDSVLYKNVYFQSNIERNSTSKYRLECEFDDLDVIKDLSSNDTVTISGKLYHLILGEVTLKECTLVSHEKTSDLSTNSSETSQEELPQRESAIGKSDKDIESLTPSPTNAKPVNNDKTGNWRYAGFGNENIDLSKYALSYYEKRFKSDNEIHAVINFTDNTTTRISYSNGMLFVTVLEYVKGEETDAALMFSGKIINDYIVYTDNGDIEDVTKLEEPIISSSEASSENSILEQSSTTENTSQSTVQEIESSASIPENTTVPIQSTSQSESPAIQQKSYVLNTSTKKVHKPSCRDIDKIEYDNLGSATSEELDSYIQAGYTACGHCHPF